MSSDSILEIFDLLRARIEVLDALADGPRQKPELEVALECSRSTVDRAIRELGDAGLLVRGEEGYALTAYGSLLVDLYQSSLERASDVVSAGPLLAELPEGAPMAHAFLEGASVARSTQPVPHRPITQFETLLRRADRFRGLSRVISQSTTPRLIHDRVLAGDLEGTLVVSSALAEYLRASEPQRVREREMLETGRYRLFEVDSLPYGLALLEVAGDDHAVVFVYDDYELLGTIHNDAPAAVAWATSLYERCRADARPISERFLD